MPVKYELFMQRYNACVQFRGILNQSNDKIRIDAPYMDTMADGTSSKAMLFLKEMKDKSEGLVGVVREYINANFDGYEENSLHISISHNFKETKKDDASK